jgi:hypothetical protein
VFGWLQADTVAAVWTAAAAIHKEKNTVEAAAAAGLQPQQAAANKLNYTSDQVASTLGFSFFLPSSGGPRGGAHGDNVLYALPH